MSFFNYFFFSLLVNVSNELIRLLTYYVPLTTEQFYYVFFAIDVCRDSKLELFESYLSTNVIFTL